MGWRAKVLKRILGEASLRRRERPQKGERMRLAGVKGGGRYRQREQLVQRPRDRNMAGAPGRQEVSVATAE